MTKENFIEIPGTLAIDGLRFRSYQGEDDFPIMLNLINRCKVVDQVERAVTVEDLKRKLEHRDNFDIHQDMLFAEVDDEPVAYGQLRWHKEMDGPYIHVIHALVDPEWRRKGIGRAMLSFFEARHRQIAEEQGHAADADKAFEVTVSDTQPDLTQLLEKEGYSTERYFIEMARPCSETIPEAPMPDGLEVRPVEEAHLDPIFAAMNEAFEDHWGHIPITEKMIASWMNNPDTDPKLWQVAWDGDEVAGMVLNFIDKKENEEYQRQRGYTEDISVRRPWRKRGLAKALLARSILMLKEMGMQETSLSVDVQNPNGALGLYEGMGYKQDKQYILYRKPMN